MKVNIRLFVVLGLILAVGLVVLIAPLASSDPDGLERVAREVGFAGDAREHALQKGPVSDYKMDGIEDERLSTALSGALGVFLTFVIGYGVFSLIRRRDRASKEISGDGL